MNIALKNLLEQADLRFADVLTFIDSQYSHSPSAFRNGSQVNAATENQGSAKIFRYALQEELSADDTLKLFVEHFQSVLDNPSGTDHQNIRQFMQHGWSGISFDID